MTTAAWTAELERMTRLARSDSGVEPFDYARIPKPDRYPAASALQVDPEGNLWVEDYVRPGSLDARTWSVFDPSGIWLGEVDLTRGLQVLEIGTGHILGMITDPLGRQRVQSFTIDRGD